MYDLVILYSGGADSRLMLEFCKELDLKPYCLMIDYGQLNREELSFAKSHLEEEMVDCQTVKIDGLNINSGLTGNGTQNNSGLVHSHHVPGRNTMFLSIAFSIAESKDIDMIWIGNDWSDVLNKFPDCCQNYIVTMNKLFKLAGPKPIEVQAPLSGISKINILKMLEKRGIEESEIYSGYGDL